MEIKNNKVFYAELPSRNIYVDSVVNDLPGYYPARSEFSVEHNNEIEQDLTDVCFLYDQIFNNGGKEYEEEKEEVPLNTLLTHVKQEPDSEDETIEKSADNESDTGESEICPTSSKGRKRKNTQSLERSSAKVRKRAQVMVKQDESVANERRDVTSCENLIDNFALGGEQKKPSEMKDSNSDTGNQMTEEEKHALEELYIAAIEIYNNRLRERNERKQFVKNHGFLDQKKIYSWYNIHNLELGDGLFSILLKKFIKLFDTAYEFDKFIQQLKLEKELRIKLTYLDELRSNGIRHKKMIPLYNQLKENRNKMQAEIKNIDISDIVALSSQETPEVIKAERRGSKKLEISHLPRYKCLTPDEKELCSSLRLTPESYLNFKQIMIDECKKEGGLRLAQARPLLKIDVNKTRKVYDYLLTQKLIWKED